MFQTGRYIYTVFMGHLAIEKVLKGLFQKTNLKVPPKTHDLIFLLTFIQVKVPEDKISFIQVLNDAQIRTRYPDNLEKLVKEYTADVIQNILIETEELLLWIEEKSS
ncbi:MAG: HEPN domain-containing protein [Candidatus Atribacteria bacterium]|nr:HEPN domain-containing protein [Candidatus Atribacteria bacterium]